MGRDPDERHPAPHRRLTAIPSQRPLLHGAAIFLSGMQERTILVEVAGRYLVDVPEGGGRFPLLAGFHGYGQRAADELVLLNRIPGAEGWIRCSIEALHPFMNAKGEPGASWMTRCDRDLRIAENVAYVDAVIGRVMAELPTDGRLVLHGFSQGAAMACRAAVLGRHPVSGVMLLGGGVPPELDGLERMLRVQHARGDRDPFLSEEALTSDAARLCNAGMQPDVVVFAGGHRATVGYFDAAAGFLAGTG